MAPTSAAQLLALVQHLAELTESSVTSALCFDSQTLHDLNEIRSTAIFDLKVALEDPIALQPSVRAELFNAVERLRHAELRLQHIAGTVVETFQAVTVTNPPTRTYGKSGRLLG